MGILIHFFQLFERRMRIDFRRRHTFVAQQFLHAFQTGTIVQHGGGKRMAQHVRRPFFLSSNPRQTGIDDTFHLVSRHSLALVVLDQRPTVPDGLLVTQGHLAAQCLLQFLTKRNDTLLISLARHLQLVRHEVDILIVQGCQLRQTHTSLIE